MSREHLPSGALPSLDTLPQMSDENVADVLQWLLYFVDAFEEHYAIPLSRWRKKRYDELHEDFDEGQLHLQDFPLSDDSF